MTKHDRELSCTSLKGHLTYSLWWRGCPSHPPGWSSLSIRLTVGAAARQSPCHTEFLGPGRCLESQHPRPGLARQSFAEVPRLSQSPVPPTSVPLETLALQDAGGI